MLAFRGKMSARTLATVASLLLLVGASTAFFAPSGPFPPWARRGVEETSRRRETRESSPMAMGFEIVPALGGVEAASAALSGHMAGVAVGLATVLWATVVSPVTDVLGPLKPVGGVFGSALTFLTTVMLGVRIATAGADARYLEGFPTDIAHPQGCTRVASDGSGNKSLAVPTFSSSVGEVQAASKEWLMAQPRTSIVTETEGYLHAKSLSRLFGFPDSIAVKVFKNASGKTEMWVQSELRIGQSDLGVNEERMSRLLGDLTKKLS